MKETNYNNNIIGPSCKKTFNDDRIGISMLDVSKLVVT